MLLARNLQFLQSTIFNNFAVLLTATTQLSSFAKNSLNNYNFLTPRSNCSTCAFSFWLLTDEPLVFSLVSLSLRLSLSRLMVFFVLKGAHSYQFLSAKRYVSCLLEDFDLRFNDNNECRRSVTRCNLSLVSVCSIWPEFCGQLALISSGSNKIYVSCSSVLYKYMHSVSILFHVTDTSLI